MLGKPRRRSAGIRAPRVPTSPPVLPPEYFEASKIMEEQNYLAGQSEAVKAAGFDQRMEHLRDFVGEEEVAEVMAMSEDEAEREAARGFKKMKRTDPAGYATLFASLPEDGQQMIRDLERKLGF